MAKASSKVRVDFTGVESYGLVPGGKYAAKAVSAEVNTNGQGNDQIKVNFEIIKGELKGSRIMNFFVLVDSALWKLKEYMNSIGLKTDGKIAIDCDKFLNKTCEIVVNEEEYEGTTRSRITNYIKLTGKDAAKKDADEDDEDEDEPEDEDEDDEDEPVDYASMTKKKRHALAQERKIKGFRDMEDGKLIRLLQKWDAEHAAEDDEDDEEEEEVKKPAKKSSKPAAKPSKKDAKKPSKKKADDDEDEDWDDDEDWDEDDD